MICNNLLQVDTERITMKPDQVPISHQYLIPYYFPTKSNIIYHMEHVLVGAWKGAKELGLFTILIIGS